MPPTVYEQLAEALDRLPNGFPRTPSQIEIAILKKIFSPDEAAFASQLRGTMEPVNVIADRVGFSVKDTRTRLMQMVKRGIIWFEKHDGKPHFRLAPFIVGIYEAQNAMLDHELAHLVEDYLRQGGAAGMMQPQPALHRVMPAQHSIKSEWILPYDDVRAVMLAAKTFSVGDCICRKQKALVGQPCHFPPGMCLSFSTTECAPAPGDISQAEALTILDKAEAIGLVHTVSNVMYGIGYICNCCGCCCGILRGITEFGIANSVASANYYAVIDPNQCVGCGACLERCQVHAITAQDGIAVVAQERCIGCGLCVTGCPQQAATLQRKPEADLIQPPENFAAWEYERLHQRGLLT